MKPPIKALQATAAGFSAAFGLERSLLPDSFGVQFLLAAVPELGR
jgi:hypothetical protein